LRRALVIVPTYNERDNIEEVARRLFDATTNEADLLVVDDSSPDGTAGLVKELGHERDDVHLIERPRKMGLGSAYLAGFEWGLVRHYEALVEMDADLSHDPAEVPRLLAALAQSDLAIGSRYVPGGKIENWSPPRRLLSYGANLYVRMMLGLPVRDSTAGFRAYRASMLDGLNLEDVRAQGYGFQIEMTRHVRDGGGVITELPITFVERVAGTSKMTLKIVLEAFALVTVLGIKHRVKRLRGVLLP
jgi:dolichol-phosphate mannosyltransferase